MSQITLCFIKVQNILGVLNREDLIMRTSYTSVGRVGEKRRS
jgi:hypothetical protein